MRYLIQIILPYVSVKLFLYSLNSFLLQFSAFYILFFYSHKLAENKTIRVFSLQFTKLFAIASNYQWNLRAQLNVVRILIQKALNGT